MSCVFKKHLQTILPIVAISVVCILIISKSASASDGVRQALSICANVIIPSLFPFMVFSAFVIKSGIYTKIGKIIGKPIGYIFNLPPLTAGAIIMGFIGGYPIGLSMTAQLFQLGVIDEKQAQRLACFNVNAGPAFIIAAVGEAIYISKNIGYILLASVLLSSLTIGIALGIISRIKDGKSKNKAFSGERTGLINAFVSATESASKSMFSVCSWIITFGVVIEFIKNLPLTKDWLTLLCGIVEVTSGCSSAAGVFPVYITAVFIAFGGFCIFFQILPNVKTTGLKIRTFLLSRIAAATLSGVYCKLLTLIFPISSEVFSNNVNTLPQNFSVSIPTTICLVITCAFLIFEVDRNKKIC
ncbi:MAG: hypothetical protein IKU25_04575 [Clostridia bacterium]|nr:hypothetical protein [Clostridia bacterium]